MKAGKLFEAALKLADIDLVAGTELKVQVKRKGSHLQLVVNAPQPTTFEALILDRSKKASSSQTPYRPTLSLGETIRTLRKSAGLTLDALAKKAGMSKGSLCSIEKDERPAGLAILKRLAKAMGIPVSLLVK